ncbi:MAG TPA: SDR family oxidoreductase [Thermoanaerobaculia bacterium]|nr:SDR family oxidoreductase [Thermoanaerobaculia bacterium]
MKNTALITGASGGIGLDLTRLFARDGWDVVLVARSEQKLREIAAELTTAHGITVHVMASDLGKPNAGAEIVRMLTDRAVTVDALVNNAGLGSSGAFVESDPGAEMEMIQVNIVALTQLTKLLLPGMVARKRGRILNVASTAAFQPGPLMAVYYATKAYVLSLSEALAEELRDTGVTVTALCPGPTETGFAAAAGVGTVRLFTLMKPASSAAVARTGYAAMKRGRRVVVEGLRNKLLTQSLRVTPRRLVTLIVRKLQEKRG